VKRATPKASEVDAAEFASGVAPLVEKLARYRPRVACFQGVTGWRAVVGARARVDLGPQPRRIGGCRVFVVPSPSGANARTSIALQAEWYDRLHRFLEA
jgi:TDG/mug DNA glycosylase family protein